MNRIKENLHKLYRNRSAIFYKILESVYFNNANVGGVIIKLLKTPIKAIKALYCLLLSLVSGNLRYISSSKFNFIAESDRVAICIGFPDWKRLYFEEYIPGQKAFFLHSYVPEFIIKLVVKKLNCKKIELFIWSYQESKNIKSFSICNNIQVNRVEDGFIRSIGLGSGKVKPLSLVIDKGELYFNTKKNTTLENLIIQNNSNFTPSKKSQSERLIAEIYSKKISKYNFPNSKEINDIKKILDNGKRTVLVLGQVEDDMSIILGADKVTTNLQLLEVAYQENKDANIIFRPHPDIARNGARKKQAKLKEYSDYAVVITDNYSINDLIDISEHVYTITSLSGFEALIQGRKVTCLGSPFYSHWGLTDDRGTGRKRELYGVTIEQIFYAAYIEYPKYILGDIDKTIHSIEELSNVETYDAYSKFRFCNFYGDTINKDKVIDSIKGKKIAIINYDRSINDLYLNIKSIAQEVSIFTETSAESVEIIESKFVNPSDVKWIAKAFHYPLSSTQKKAINDTLDISNKYQEILEPYFSNVFDENIKTKVLETLAMSVENITYNKFMIVRYLKQIREQYDIVIISGKKSIYYSRLIYQELDKSKIIFLTKSHIPFWLTRGSILDLSEYKQFKNKYKQFKRKHKQFKSKRAHSLLKNTWYTYVEHLKSEIAPSEVLNDVVICGNLKDRNYAYYPSSVEIINLLDSLKLNTSFLPAQKISIPTIKEYRWLVSEISVLTTLFTSTKMIDGLVMVKKLQTIVEVIEAEMLFYIYQAFPSHISDYIAESIRMAIRQMPNQLHFLANMIVSFEGEKFFITTMERNMFSRLATLAAQFNKVKTIGVQPQVISTNMRFKEPLVDSMLVIDEKQKDIFEIHGYSPENMSCVGSANLRKHIHMIRDADAEDDRKNFRILFIMQHSMQKNTVKAVVKLSELCRNTDIELYLKPHPHQEKSVIQEVYSLVKNKSNVTLLSPTENTYHAIKNSDVISGFSSSVLLEAMLADKDVLILEFEEMDESINYASLNIALSTSLQEEIMDTLSHYKNNTDSAIELREKRASYIREKQYYYKDIVLKEHLCNIAGINPYNKN